MGGGAFGRGGRVLFTVPFSVSGRCCGSVIVMVLI